MLHGKGKLTRVINHRSNSDAIFAMESGWWIGVCGERIAGYHTLTMNDAPHLPSFGETNNFKYYITNECVFCTDPEEERAFPLTDEIDIKNMKLI